MVSHDEWLNGWINEAMNHESDPNFSQLTIWPDMNSLAKDAEIPFRCEVAEVYQTSPSQHEWLSQMQELIGHLGEEEKREPQLCQTQKLDHIDTQVLNTVQQTSSIQHCRAQVDKLPDQ